jgi:hypothetical protein
MKQRITAIFRDGLLLALGVGILVWQAFLVVSAQPILIFLGLFLIFSVPFMRGDKKDGTNPFVRLILGMLGVPLPDQDSSDDSRTNTTDSSKTGPIQ